MTTWYVRPDTSHNGTRDGTSYATAWGGWSEITWGVGGVVGGDTLYVCGAHSYAAAITVGAHTGSSLATRCTISGDYTADPGSLTFTTNGDFLQNDRAWTRITGLTFTAAGTGASNNNCIFVTDTATNCKYDNNIFNGTDTAAIFSFFATTGQDHADVEISDNVFNGGGGSTGGAIAWPVVNTSALSTMTRLSILRNEFRNVSANNDQVIHLRWENDTDASNKITDLRIEDNIFDTFKGLALRIGGDYTVVGISPGLSIKNNTFKNGSLSNSALGGAIFVKCASSGLVGGEISGNRAYNVTGAAGFVDLLYCSGIRVEGNECDGIYTTTIDGNGVLFDLGCTSCVANSNTFKNMPGKSGASNSGVGIMVLDATNIQCSGNIVIGCKWGVHLGAAGSGQSCVVANNTVVECFDGAVFTTATADLANCTVKNNIFVGDGYSVYDQTAVAWSAENNNCFYGFASGTSNHTLGAQSVTTNPKLQANYRPSPESSPGAGDGSPCIGAGVYIQGARHFGGLRLLNPADIGAQRRTPTRTLDLTRL